MANNFSTDPSCKALWRFESGALTADSIGTNTLNFINSPIADTSIFKEGAASLKLVNASSQYGYILDGSLPTGFPWKSTDTVMQGTVCCWIYPNSSGAYRRIWAKYDYAGSLRTLDVEVNSGALNINWGSGSSFTTYSTGFTLSTGQWYHLTVIVDGVNKILNVILYNAVTGACQYYTTSPSAVLGVGTNSWMVGSSGTYPGSIDGDYWDGWIDELVVFNRLLYLQEIEKIINQIYTGPYTAASPGNNFSGDSRFQARWRFESGALLTDSINSNNLSVGYGTPVADPFGVEEGADALYLASGSAQYLNIADSALSANFPLKSTDTVKKITICGWFIPTIWGGSYPAGIWWKDNGSELGAGAFLDSAGHLKVVVGNLGAPTYIDTGFVLNIYSIYHIAFVMDGVNGTLTVRVYNAATRTASDYSGSIGTISVGAGAFTLGKNVSSGVTFGGWLDEFVVANALLSDTEIDAIRGEIFGAPITRNLSTTASVVSSTSSVMLGVTRKLATSPAVSTSTGSPLLNILRKLTCSPAAGSSTSAVMLAVLRKLACSPAVVSSVSTPNLAVQRNLATLAVALSETSDTVYLNLNAVRQLSTIAAVVSSTSAVNLAILRKLVSECVVVTSTPEVMLAVLRKLTTDIPVVSTTSAAELGYLLRLATAANVTTETPAIMLQVLRRLLTRVAVQTETSAAQLIITAAPVPLPPSLHSLAEGWLAGEVPTEDLFKASQAWLAGEEQKAEE